MEIQRRGSPNFLAGRKGARIIAIIDHITSGKYPGCLDWLCNPAADASAHYLVTRGGMIIQMVHDEDSAWHAKANRPSWRLYNGTGVNRYTIGIEHEGYKENGGNGALTEAQYQATLWLHRTKIQEHRIPIDRDHIIGHYQTDSVTRANCPGQLFPWSRLMQDLTSGSMPTGARTVQILVGGTILEGIVVDSKTYAPVRQFGNVLGFPVNWDPLAGVSVGGVKIFVRAFNGISYAQVRELGEGLGKKVTWNNGKVVII